MIEPLSASQHSSDRNGPSCSLCGRHVINQKVLTLGTIKTS